MDPTRRSLFGLLAAGPALLALRFPQAMAEAPPAAISDAYWAKLRSRFAIPAGESYFNTGTLGATPSAVLDCVIDDLRTVEEELARFDYRPDGTTPIAGYRPEESIRAKLAALVGADPEEVGLTHNATMGMNFVASGLTLAPGDEVLITDQEHPGGRCGWDQRAARQGIAVTQVPVDPIEDSPESILARFTQAMTDKVRVLAVPHITSGRGVVMPVKALCAAAREREIFAVIDGAQAPGQRAVDLHDMGCDAYFSSPHKWLLAPVGCGFLYVRRARQPELYATLASAAWDKHEDGGHRLTQYGTRNRSLLAGLEATLDFWAGLPTDAIYARNQSMGDQLRAGLAAIPGAAIRSPTHPELAGSMVNWTLEGRSGEELMDALWDRGRVRVRAVGDEAVRQCCHLYNSPDDVEATLAIARSLARS